jgi:hypothetical protein
MKMKTALCAFTAVMLLSGAGFIAAPLAAHAQPVNQCFSARNCGGNVLNNRDAHNCKNSGGKSWLSGVTGQCHNL